MQSTAALFAAVFATPGVAHTVGDQWIDVAIAVSTFYGASLPSGARRLPSVRGSIHVSQMARVDVARRSALLGVTA
jgi:hypothetical protein